MLVSGRIETGPTGLSGPRGHRKYPAASTPTNPRPARAIRHARVGFWCDVSAVGLASAGREDEALPRCIRFRSARRSAELWYRSSGSFSSALLMMLSSSSGTRGFSSTGAVGARLRIASNTAADVVPPNARRPVIISYSTTPSENTSVRASSCFPSACSGDI